MNSLIAIARRLASSRTGREDLSVFYQVKRANLAIGGGRRGVLPPQESQ